MEGQATYRRARNERTGAPHCHDGGVSPDPDPASRPAADPAPRQEPASPAEPSPSPSPSVPSRPPLLQPPLVKPPRSAMTVRDMVVAVAVLVGVVLVLAGVTRSCSFAPGGPTIDPAGVPVVDAPAALRELRVPFPLRIPAVPAGWRSNSVSQERVEGGRVVRVGYLTPDGQYLRLLQSDASEPVVLAVETGANPAVLRGPVDVGGQRWVVYTRGSDEPIWTADVPTPGGGSVRMLITGSGTEDEARTLAGAAVAGELLPARAL
jgi:hypothetical protein